MNIFNRGLNGRRDKPPPPLVCRALADWPSSAAAAHDWRDRQHCWASQPVPDKYAFKATDKQTDEQISRTTSPLNYRISDVA